MSRSGKSRRSLGGGELVLGRQTCCGAVEGRSINSRKAIPRGHVEGRSAISLSSTGTPTR
ncbi:hypothetical protein ZHAS_00021716 [Anopheles sinensis]|uniref:Uncharacterized protein n=1 Tax=Anopheles sinensis TaxID=74873 RepID=A0A084WT54_ANOSI|nr:hypothetical protein ZHAS_00021716 [Anopheles sinensis]